VRARRGDDEEHKFHAHFGVESRRKGTEMCLWEEQGSLLAFI
jgi:hypothetical protein